MKHLLITAMTLALATGCKKNAPDTQPPVIQVISPTPNQVFNAGDSVHIRAQVSDNTEIHEVHCFVTIGTTSTLVLHFEEHLDAASFTLDKAFAVQSGVTYRIEIDANDHSDNAAQQLISVSGN